MTGYEADVDVNRIFRGRLPCPDRFPEHIHFYELVRWRCQLKEQITIVKLLHIRIAGTVVGTGLYQTTFPSLSRMAI